jgi:hypothetical protein
LFLRADDVAESVGINGERLGDSKARVAFEPFGLIPNDPSMVLVGPSSLGLDIRFSESKEPACATSRNTVHFAKRNCDLRLTSRSQPRACESNDRTLATQQAKRIGARRAAARFMSCQIRISINRLLNAHKRHAVAAFIRALVVADARERRVRGRSTIHRQAIFPLKDASGSRRPPFFDKTAPIRARDSRGRRP